jgi:hypothetical protein
MHALAFRKAATAIAASNLPLIPRLSDPQ